MVSLLKNHPLETDRPLKNWASLHQIRQLNLCNNTQWQHPQKILLMTCKHGLISTAGRTIICYTFSNKEITDCVYIFIAPSLAMMQTRSRCFSSLRVRIIGSVMLKFGCSSLKNKQPKSCHEHHHDIWIPDSFSLWKRCNKLLLTSENRKFWLENPLIHANPFGKLQKIWAVICGNAIIFLHSF